MVIGENDDAGREGAKKVVEGLVRDVASIRVVFPPTGVKDLREWRSGEFGVDRAELLAAIDGARDEAHPTDIEFTDTGNAARYAKIYGDLVRYVPAWDKWLIWDGSRWAPDDRLAVRRYASKVVETIVREAQAIGPGDTRYKMVLEWGRKSADEPRIRRMLELVKERVAVSPTDLDANPWFLNTLSGTIDLRTGELLDHDPADLITKVAPVAYDPDAECPLWIESLGRITGGSEPLMDFLQRLFGMCLSGDITEQILPVFHGVGANGKSLTIDTISGMMGDYAAQAPPDLLMVRHGDEHPTEIADLFGRRLVVASETEEGRKLRIQLVKKLTGDATLKGRFMRADYFEFARTHKTILVTNNVPVVTEASNAIWRRLKLVPFDVVIPPEEQDRELLARLKPEWPGILAWAVRGCLEWQLEGLGVPEEVQSATDAYRGEQDILAPFLEAKCLITELSHASRTDLWEAWSNWAVGANRSDLTRNGLYERVRMIPGVTDDDFTQNGRTVRGFKGLALCN